MPRAKKPWGPSSHKVREDVPLKLTKAEGVIIRLLALDLSEPQIAKRQKLGSRTINQHVRRMMKRNGVETRLGLVRAYEAGGVTLIDGRKR